MSKVALDMDMPESCSKCKFLYEFQGIKKCQLMNALNNGASRLSQNTFTEKRHEKCPLRELPQRYQKLEEQGRLIKLPCKVGDGIFIVKRYGVEEANITGISEADDISCFCFKVYIDPDCEEVVALEDFNETWFLTKSEAEAKLKELRG